MSDKKDSTNNESTSPKIVTKKRINKKLRKIKPFDFKKLKNLNKNAVLAASLASILLLVGLFSVVFHNSTKEAIVVDSPPEKITELETASVMAAKVTYKKGVAEYKTGVNVGSNWEIIPKDLEIEVGMSVRTTGAASLLIVTLDDGSAVRLDANTEATFETLTVSRTVILQVSGHIYNRVTPNSNRTYIVQTENGQFQSLGTAFKTTSSGDEESVEVYQSNVQETSTNKKVKEGQKLIVKDFNNPQNDETIKDLNIEEVKIDPFVSWNRDEDQKDENFKKALGFLSDIEGPEISITSPKLGNSIEVDAAATEGTIEIKGTTEKGSTLSVQSKSVSNSGPVDVTVSNNGTFKTPVLKAAIGSSIFTFVAKDRTGNETTLNITLLFKKKNPVQKQGIELSLESIPDPDVLTFSWLLEGVTTPDGIKLIYSKTEGPIFPDDEKQFIETGSETTVNVADLDSNTTYYFKVCRYSSVTMDCDIYSNEVSVKIP